MFAILNSQIQLVSETRLFGLAMTSVLSHWLTTKPFVLSRYNFSTTRMVGRPVNYTVIYTSLLISLKTKPPVYIIKFSSSTTSLNIPPISSHSLHLSIPYINLHSPPHINPPHIPTEPTFH